jgi:hypothetical protein
MSRVLVDHLRLEHGLGEKAKAIHFARLMEAHLEAHGLYGARDIEGAAWHLRTAYTPSSYYEREAERVE